MIWRLVDDLDGLHEGSCISELEYKSVPWFNKCLYEPISDDDKSKMIVCDEKSTINNPRILCMLFYTQDELVNFMKKVSL